MITTPQQPFTLSIKRLLQCVIFSLILSLPLALQAQQTDNWYFGSPTIPGKGIRINFTSGTPVVTHNYPIYTEEGSSSISNASGVPLFYTDGVSIWDASTATTFGTGLLGGVSSTQSAIVMPKPGATNEWLVFTSGQAQGINNRINYYTVSGTPGAFTISAATNLAGTTVGEGLFIIGSTKAGSSFWVIAREVGSTGVVRAWDVTNAGAVNATAVTSTLSGPSFTNTNYTSRIGTIKSNTCQNKLAFTYLNGDVDLVNFNAATGQVVTNTAIRLAVPSTGGNSGSYGIEFSENDAYLYITNLAGRNLSRYDIVGATLNNSFGTTTHPAGQLQTAPDGNIYMGIQGDLASGPGYLGVISNPNTAGATFSATGLQVTTDASVQGYAYWGLPTFPKSLIVQEPEIIPSSGGEYCTNTAIPLSFTFSGPINASTVIWDVTSGTGGTFSPLNTDLAPTVTFTTTGAKTIRLRFDDNCGRSYTETINITIVAPKTPVGAVNCSSPNLVMTNTNSDPDAPKYIWYRNSVGAGNLIGAGSPFNYPIGNDAARPTQICVSVAASVPSTTTGSNTIASSNTLSGIFATSPYTSPTFTVLADRIVLKSFRIGFRYSTFYGPINITATIRQGATVVYSNTYTNLMIPDGSIYTYNVNTSLQPGTYTIQITTNKDPLEMQSSTWLGATNAGEITYSGGAGSGYAVANLSYDYFDYTVLPTCVVPVCYPVTCSLPVEWVSVNAKKKGKDVAVNWAVAMELNNDRFEVQRSLDGIHFITIGTVNGRGNGTSYKEYSFIDQNVLSGNIYYRVVQYDFDGKNTNSNIVTVNTSDLLELISIYPNPSTNEFNLEWFADAVASYQVFDVRGVVVGAGTLEASKGPQAIGADFVPGIYVVKVFAAEETLNIKLIKQ